MRYWFAIMALAAVPVGLSASDASDVLDADCRPIVDRYVDATHTQQAALRDVQMEVDIDAKLVKLQKQGRLTALRSISKIGSITYKALGFSGDNTVKKEVIARYLSAESEGRENGTISITPENYKFKYKNTVEWYGRQVAILQISPRRKAVGLFKGELWVDSATGMPIRESGQFVKSPSVFLKKIAFVREYEIAEGIAIPKHIESKVDTRLVGRAELDINFSHFAKNSEEITDPATIVSQAQ
ncbi:MAG: hypothetical protein ABL967_04210 [Bryobacteraceae bacterium]